MGEPPVKQRAGQPLRTEDTDPLDKRVIALHLGKCLGPSGPSALAIAQYLRYTAVRGCELPYGTVLHGLYCVGFQSGVDDRYKRC